MVGFTRSDRNDAWKSCCIDPYASCLFSSNKIIANKISNKITKYLTKQ